MPLNDRKAVAAKIDFEGGIIAALEYGITVNDMPTNDTDLRDVWAKLVLIYELYEKHASEVEFLLGSTGT